LGLYHVINTQGLLPGLWTFVQNAPLVLLFILAICLLSNVLISASFVYVLLHNHAPIILRICLFLFVGYIIGSTGVLGLSRYRIAVAPLLWIALCWLTENLFTKKNESTY
jgi:hypothetical protein